jgi:hypothetical protein
LLLVVAAAAGMASCTSGGGHAAAPSPGPGTPAASVPASGSASTSAPASAAAGASPAPVVVTTEQAATQFITPSDNIGCYLAPDGVRCDISEHTWPLPPRPRDCDADWGAVVELAARASVGACVSDSAHGGVTRVLAYGHGLRVGDYRCDSARDGLACTNLRTRHGFVLSRAKVSTH